MHVNCDLGEGMGVENAILPFIAAANIACGLHAGSPSEIAATILLAKQYGVQVGAHPSWNDPGNFGRTEQMLPESEIISLLLYQLGAVQAICQQFDHPMQHVKPHGALYNQAARDPFIANAIITAIRIFNPALQLYALSGSQLAKLGKDAGLLVKEEAFADRRYTATGELASRNLPNAVLTQKEEVLEQVKMIWLEQRVRTTENTLIPLSADTVCIHGDGSNAVELAKAIQVWVSTNSQA